MKVKMRERLSIYRVLASPDNFVLSSTLHEVLELMHTEPFPHSIYRNHKALVVANFPKLCGQGSINGVVDRGIV